MFNSVQLIGNVGANPEIRVTQSGRKVATIRLATSEKWRDRDTGETKERTQWHNCVVWNEKLAPVVEQYVSKGSQLFILGRVEYREHTDEAGVKRWYTDIIVETMKLLGKAGNGRRESPSPRDEDAPPERGRRDDDNGDRGGNGSFSDEIPF